MNPLQKYFRQPKIYIQLPSKGNYYPEGTLTGDYENFPIFAMTGSDELLMKTPDALFNGESSVKLIESCCPYITNAKNVPSIDIDTILAAIRIATHGDDLTFTHTCSKCQSIGDYTISTQLIIDHYSNLQFENTVQIDDLTIMLRPLNYGEMTKFNMEHFVLKKMLNQLLLIEGLEERQVQLDEIYQKMALIQAAIFVSSVDSIQIQNSEIVTNGEHIAEWLGNCDAKYYDSIRNKLENNKEIWKVPSSKVSCSDCENEDDVEIKLDQSDFFV